MDIQPKIELRNVEKNFYSKERGSILAIQGVSFKVMPGEFISIVGPSGCGKSTMFNITAGLLSPSGGQVFIDGKDVSGKVGNVGYMLQKDLLLPWRNILDNVVLGAELLDGKMDEIYAEARRLMSTFGLDGFETSWPSMLSGGMRQRAALMRTILSGKDILLLDEPFGALDAITKGKMQEWLLQIWAAFNRTIIFVTHDIDEAIFLSDRVYVMAARPGTIKKEITVELPRPRSMEDKGTPAFIEMRNTILKLLDQEQTSAS